MSESNRRTSSDRHSWGEATVKATWQSTLSDHIRKVLSMANEAAALIPAVRTDINLVGDDGEENELFKLSGHLISKNGIFITDFHEVKQAALDAFHLEESDDDLATVTYDLFYPNPKEAGKFIQIHSLEEMEASVAVFQAALKFRRPQIVRQAVKKNAEIISTYLTNQLIDSSKNLDNYENMNIALHQIWELSMLSTNHKRIFASKLNVIQFLIDTIQTIPTLNAVTSHHVTCAAILWCLTFHHDGRNRLLKSKYDFVNLLMNSLINVRKIEYKKKSTKKKSMSIVYTYCAFIIGALLSCTHHGSGLKVALLRLDDIRNLAFDVTDAITKSSNINSNNQPVWPISRNSLQDLILFYICNCIVRKHAQVNLRQIWGKRSKNYSKLREEREVRAKEEITSKKKKKGSKKKKASVTNFYGLVSSTSCIWNLSDVPKMIVTSSSIRTRLATISVISEFARDVDGRVAFINDDQIIGQICDITVWGLEWLVKVHANDVDVNSIVCMRKPILELDEDIELVYRILEHCALSLWGWALCACEMMLGNGSNDGKSDEIQLKAMSAMTSVADQMSRPGSKKSKKGADENSVMADLKGLSIEKEASPMEIAMERVPGILTSLAGMSNGLNHEILTGGGGGSIQEYLSARNTVASTEGGMSASPSGGRGKRLNRNRHRSPPGIQQPDATVNNSDQSSIIQRLIYYGVTYDDIMIDEQDTTKNSDKKNNGNNTDSVSKNGLFYLHADKHLARIARIESLGAGCISTIATVKQMAGAILRNGIVPILLKLLFKPGEDSNECRECAASALCLFSSGSEEGRKEIYKCKGIDALLDVIAPIPPSKKKKTDTNRRNRNKSSINNEDETYEDDGTKHSYYKSRATPKLLGFCTEILHREAYLLDDVIVSKRMIGQMVNSLTTVKAPVKFNEETKTWDANTGQDPKGDFILQTHVACAVWRVGIHKENAKKLGEEGACAALTNVALPLIYQQTKNIVNNEIESEIKNDDNNEDISQSNDEVEKDAASKNREYKLMPTKESEKIRTSLLDFTILSLWMLSYNTENCNRMARCGSIELLVSILELVPHENSYVGHYDCIYDGELNYHNENDSTSGVSYSGLHEFALKCLWVLCSSSVDIARQAVKAGIVLALRRLPIDKMRWGASVLQILLVTDKINRDIISNEYGDDILEQMLIFMMRSNVVSLMSYGALGAARCAITTSGSYRLVNVNGCLETMFQLLSSTNDLETQVHTARALLNLSKSKNIQEQMASIGLYTLIECSWSPTCEEARMVINGILHNIKNNPSNRDLLYRAELHIKSFVESQVKNHYLLQTLASQPYRVQSSLRSIGGKATSLSTMNGTNGQGRRQSPLQSLGPIAVKNKKIAAKRRSNYDKWIEKSGIAGEKTAIDALTNGYTRKPKPKYLPTLSQVDYGKPSFSMTKAGKKSISRTSLSSLPGKYQHKNTMYNPTSSTASALPPVTMPTKESSEDDNHLDQSELPEGLETKLLNDSLLEVSGVPQLNRSMKRPMSNMYTSVPPNSPLQPPLQPVHRNWGTNTPSQQLDPSTGGFSSEELQTSIQQYFWERGPMNVTFLKASSREIKNFIHVVVKPKKYNKGKDTNSTLKEHLKNNSNISSCSLNWKLQSPAYYWRSMFQETNSFGVQMIVTCQVLLDMDPLPTPPIQLPEGTKDELPPAPETPGIPQDEPKPFQIPLLGPPVPQKHILPVDDHNCQCNSLHSSECGWKDYSSLLSDDNCELSEKATFSAYEGGSCGMFGRLRDRHMQYRMVTKRIEKVQIVEEKEEIKWIFESRLTNSDAKSYFDEDIYPLMCKNDWDRVIEQEHFSKFLKSKLEKVNIEYNLDNEIDMAKTYSKIYEVIVPHYKHLMSTFEFYSAMGNSSDMSQMLYNQCMDLMGDTNIVEPKNKKMDRSALDGIFIEANKEGEEQQESDVGDTNADRALMRFELVEMLIRIALKKYVQTGICSTIEMAVEKIMIEHILPNDASGSCSAAIHDIDEFRRECLYNPDVDALLRKHDKTLRAIFEKFQDEDNIRLKNSRMSYKCYMRFLKQVKFINEDFTLRECRVTYVWSRMKVIDEVASHDTWGYITYIDWLEALARMAQLKCVPSPEDLEEMQNLNILKSKETHTYGLLRAWHKMSVGNNQGKLLDRNSGEWGAPPERPWVEKFQALLDLLFCVFDEDGDGVDLEDLFYWKPKN